MSTPVAQRGSASNNTLPFGGTPSPVTLRSARSADNFRNEEHQDEDDHLAHSSSLPLPLSPGQLQQPRSASAQSRVTTSTSATSAAAAAAGGEIGGGGRQPLQNRNQNSRPDRNVRNDEAGARKKNNNKNQNAREKENDEGEEKKKKSKKEKEQEEEEEKEKKKKEKEEKEKKEAEEEEEAKKKLPKKKVRTSSIGCNTTLSYIGDFKHGRPILARDDDPEAFVSITTAIVFGLGMISSLLIGTFSYFLSWRIREPRLKLLRNGAFMARAYPFLLTLGGIITYGIALPCLVMIASGYLDTPRHDKFFLMASLFFAIFFGVPATILEATFVLPLDEPELSIIKDDEANLSRFALFVHFVVTGGSLWYWYITITVRKLNSAVVARARIWYEFRMGLAGKTKCEASRIAIRSIDEIEEGVQLEPIEVGAASARLDENGEPRVLTEEDLRSPVFLGDSPRQNRRGRQQQSGEEGTGQGDEGGGDDILQSETPSGQQQQRQRQGQQQQQQRRRNQRNEEDYQGFAGSSPVPGSGQKLLPRKRDSGNGRGRSAGNNTGRGNGRAGGGRRNNAFSPRADPGDFDQD